MNQQARITADMAYLLEMAEEIKEEEGPMIRAGAEMLWQTHNNTPNDKRFGVLTTTGRKLVLSLEELTSLDRADIANCYELPHPRKPPRKPAPEEQTNDH